jgi:hypothetical protein
LARGSDFEKQVARDVHPWAEVKTMSETERGTERLVREMERAKAEQLDIARSWILLFALAATVGFWWVFYNQLELDFYLSWLLGFVAAYVVSLILSYFVGMRLGKKYARKLKSQFGQSTAQQVFSSVGAETGLRYSKLVTLICLALCAVPFFYMPLHYAVPSALGIAVLIAALRLLLPE